MDTPPMGRRPTGSALPGLDRALPGAAAALPIWLDALALGRASRRRYVRELALLDAYLGSVAAERQTLEDYLDSERRRGLSAQTIAWKRGVLGRFLAFYRRYRRRHLSGRP